MSKKTKSAAPTMEILDVKTTEAPAQEEASKNMTISLAKANKLRNSLDSFLNETRDQIAQKAALSVTAFPGESLEQIKAKVEIKKADVANLAREYGILSSIRASLKTQIGILNASTGVGEIMAQIERLDRIIETFSSIYENRRYSAGVQNLFDEEAVEYSISRNKTLSESDVISASLNGPTTFSVALYTKDDIAGEISGLRNLRKAKAELEEKRNTLNYSSTITLDGSVVEALEAKSLI